MCWLLDCLWTGEPEEPNPDEGLEFLVTLFGLSVLSYFIGGGGGLFLTMLGWMLAFCILECRGGGGALHEQDGIIPVAAAHRKVKGRGGRR